MPELDFAKLREQNGTMATSPPEARLLEEARTTRGLSQNRAGKLAGITGTRWRQIISGTWQPMSPKVTRTVADMAHAVGVTPDAMRDIGRDDIAAAMDVDTTQGTQEGEAGYIRGWPLRPNEELWWEPQTHDLPGSPAIRYVYRWRDPEHPDDYIESSKGLSPSRDPLEVAQLFREMLAEAHGPHILDNSESTSRN